jgi:hypothetical protein
VIYVGRGAGAAFGSVSLGLALPSRPIVSLIPRAEKKPAPWGGRAFSVSSGVSFGRMGDCGAELMFRLG